MNSNCVLLRDDFKESYTGIYTVEKHRYFVSSLVSILSSYLAEPLVVESVSSQLSRIPSFATPTLSLDKYYGGSFQLDVSRHFRVGDGVQAHGYKLDSTTKPLQEQLSSLQSLGFSRVILVDDDSVSGETVNRISSLVNCEIVGSYFIASGYKDVLDVRDFLFNSRNGGLVFSNDSTVFRAPYVAPYVNLSTRSLVTDPLAVSRLVMELNRSIYSDLPLQPMYANFLKHYGLSPKWFF